MPDLHGWITQQINAVEALAREQESSLWQVALGDDSVAAAVLRRCAADRKILGHHQPAGTQWTPYGCNGCGVDSEYGHEVDHTNDCPTLQALAEGYSLTEEQLAQLDRPEPERPEPAPPVNLSSLVAIMSAQLTSNVPPALRGPNWTAG